MAEALWLSQMAATRGRAGQDREERGWSPVLRGPRLAVMQPVRAWGGWLRVMQSAHGQDLARQRSIDSARPHWQRGINRFNANPEEEQDPQGTGVVKDKGTPGQEPPGSTRGNLTLQPAGIK